MSIDLDELQAAAEAATPGPWEAEADDGEGMTEVNAGSALTTWTEHEDGLRIGSPARSWRTTDRIVERDDLYDEDFEQAAADAEFIAAANPAVILELVAAHRAALARIARVQALHYEDDHACAECSFEPIPEVGFRGVAVPYPCPTVQALPDDPVS